MRCAHRAAFAFRPSRVTIPRARWSERRRSHSAQPSAPAGAPLRADAGFARRRVPTLRVSLQPCSDRTRLKPHRDLRHCRLLGRAKGRCPSRAEELPSHPLGSGPVSPFFLRLWLRAERVIPLRPCAPPLANPGLADRQGFSARLNPSFNSRDRKQERRPWPEPFHSTDSGRGANRVKQSRACGEKPSLLRAAERPRNRRFVPKISEKAKIAYTEPTQAKVGS